MFVSGYTDPERFVDLNLGDRRRFLQKPFSREALEQSVRSLLSRPASSANDRVS